MSPAKRRVLAYGSFVLLAPVFVWSFFSVYWRGHLASYETVRSLLYEGLAACDAESCNNGSYFLATAALSALPLLAAFVALVPHAILATWLRLERYAAGAVLAGALALYLIATEDWLFLVPTAFNAPIYLLLLFGWIVLALSLSYRALELLSAPNNKLQRTRGVASESADG